MAKADPTTEFSIGTLAQESAVNIETIRYYERIGVMPRVARSAGGYRQYTADHLKRLTFIRRGRELGFRLEELRNLLHLVDGHSYTCAQVRALTLEHVADIRQKIADLRVLERAMTSIAAKCSGNEVPDCPIIDALFRAHLTPQRTDNQNQRTGHPGRQKSGSTYFPRVGGGNLAEFIARPAVAADAPAVAEIYTQGIEDRIATFETDPRTAADIEPWFGTANAFVTVIDRANEIVGYAVAHPYADRRCYRGIAEFSVYVRRSHRGRGVGRVAMEALIAASKDARLWKLLSRVFPENRASLSLLERMGFARIGVHMKHGKLDGAWKDVVVVERLIPENID
ncbi:MAG TPA: arsinothricin resistance N-acetyltransferase ArsN1 family A [Rhizomicrobium sp.]|jgi:Cu(I)-responsive transcriptional regulator|nr:arsinothricin resistance N-acetyltransferase ArsN1 family A [Rhizomicrobium sp.]